MIKINLAGRKKSSAFTAASIGTATLSLRSIELSALKELPLKKALIPMFIAIIASIISSTLQDNELKKLDVELDSINAEKPKLQAAANKMKSYEDLKKGMENDEFVIRTKLETVRKLAQNRTETTKFLQDLSKITPPSVWLTGVSYDGSTIEIKGMAVNFRQISPFLKSLNENPFFQGLTLKDSQTVKTQYGWEAVNFELISGAKK
ncbi:MAG: PilN domain-containing protein [Oligoflexia bacterium]|nr:PilN domain-containing protein [Oligoflexia bacterium]